MSGGAFAPTGIPTYASRATMAGANLLASGAVAWLSEVAREGWFRFSTADNSANVTADPQQGLYVAPSGSPTGASGAWVRIAPRGEIYGEWFGAVGDDATDNTTALQAAITYGLTLGVCRCKLGGGVFRYTNLVFPAYGSTAAGFKVFEFEGVAHPSTTFGSAGAFTLNTGGTILKSLATTGGYGIAVGGSGISNYTLGFKNLTGRLYANPSIGFLSAAFAQQLIVENVNIDVGVYNVGVAQPTAASTYGIMTPLVNNGALTHLKNVSVAGLYNAIGVNEHTCGDDIHINGCLIGLVYFGGYHASRMGRVLIQQTQKPILVQGLNRMSIAQLDIEHDTNGSAWQATTVDITDTSNLGVGEITWAVVRGGVGIDHTFTVAGATGLILKEMGSAGAF